MKSQRKTGKFHVTCFMVHHAWLQDRSSTLSMCIGEESYTTMALAFMDWKVSQHVYRHGNLKQHTCGWCSLFMTILSQNIQIPTYHDTSLDCLVHRPLHQISIGMLIQLTIVEHSTCWKGGRCCSWAWDFNLYSHEHCKCLAVIKHIARTLTWLQSIM